MKVTEKDVAHVAELAALELTAEERTRMIKDLSSILDYIDRLNQLDTAGVPPMAQISHQVSNHAAHVTEKDNSSAEEVKSDPAMREDHTLPSLDRELALKNAPQAENGFFKVPKVIDLG